MKAACNLKPQGIDVKTFLLPLAGLLFASMGLAAQAASITGDSVGFSFYYLDPVTPYDTAGPVTVTDGGVTFFDDQYQNFKFIVTGSAITLTALKTINNAGLTHYVFTDFSRVFPGTYTLGATTGSSFVSFAATTVGGVFTLDLFGAQLANGATAVYNLTSPVPEPAEYAMVMAGLATLIAFKVAKKKARQRLENPAPV